MFILLLYKVVAIIDLHDNIEKSQGKEKKESKKENKKESKRDESKNQRKRGELAERSDSSAACLKGQLFKSHGRLIFFLLERELRMKTE